jgi:hypothetical protein
MVSSAYPLLGLAADFLVPGATQGRGGLSGLLHALFTPSAQGMDSVYAPDRFGGSSPAAMNSMLGKITAAVFGAATILPVIGETIFQINALRQGFAPSIYSTPFSPAGFIPQLWNQGFIRNWGASVGTLL